MNRVFPSRAFEKAGDSDMPGWLPRKAQHLVSSDDSTAPKLGVGSADGLMLSHLSRIVKYANEKTYSDLFRSFRVCYELNRHAKRVHDRIN